MTVASWLRRWALTMVVGVLASSGGTAPPAWAQDGTHPAQGSVQRRAVRRDAGYQVYLFRGIGNVFSLGMDDLAAKLNRIGIRSYVENHAAAGAVTAMILQDYQAGRRKPVILVGHSMGGIAVMEIASALAEKRIPVALVVTYAPFYPPAVPGNVQTAINLYQSSDAFGTRLVPGPGFRGRLLNLDFDKETDFGHANIDKAGKLHAQTIGFIRRALGGGNGQPGQPKPGNGTPSAQTPASTMPTAQTPAQAPANETPSAGSAPAAQGAQAGGSGG